ncbi:MAG: hypothetical protein HFJ38_05810 [Bacilli bacterium]|nr:hypothetical protein [Bacilli bacterium]
MLFDKDCHSYYEKKSIDLKNELTTTDLAIIKKLEVKVKEEFYTQYEYENLKEHLGIYVISNENDNELKYLKPSKYGVTNNEYDQIYNKFNEIDNKYKKILIRNSKIIDFDDIWFREKQHVIDKLIIALDNRILNDVQKKQLFEFIMNIENATLIQKERFILYYGLQENNNEIYNIAQIAQLHNCTKSNIRQAVNRIKSKITHLSNEKIEILRQILNELNIKF